MRAAIVCAVLVGCGNTDDVSKVPREEYPSASSAGGSAGGAGGAGGGGDGTIFRGVSGSRLRAVYKLGGDGSREFTTWYDLERDEDCKFATMATNPGPTRRCLPVSGDLIDDGSGSYIDAQCTRRADQKVQSAPLSRKGNPLRRYRLFAEDAGEEFRAHMFVHGDVFIEASEAQPATLQLYTKTSTNCVPQEPREVTRTWVYLDEISLDDFVFWTEAVE